METRPEPSCPSVTVLYDGACPLCRREIGMYRDLDALQPVAWRDVSAPNAVLPPGGDQAAYLARFHVQLADGTVLSGAEAFVALWSALPGWRWLARFGRLPGAMLVMEASYRFFLHLRPTLQRIVRWLELRRPGSTPPRDRCE
jgi:ubiquinone biosynthesis monooxygenase Coq7